LIIGKIVMKITKLTKEQENNLAVYRDKWLNKIFNYELYNSKSIESIQNSGKELYKFFNLKKPQVIVMDSPYSCQIAINLLTQVKNQVRDQVKNQVKNQIWNQVRDQVKNQVRDQVENQVKNQVRDQVRDQIEVQVGTQVMHQIIDQIWNQIRDQIKNGVRDQVGNQISDQIEDQVRNQVGSQVVGTVFNKVIDQKLNYFSFSSYINYSDFGWLSFYNYFNENFNIISISDILNKVISFVEHSFMSIQLEGLLIVSRYPNFISRNSNNDLHNTTRSAISFADGYEQFYVNGRSISKEIFENCQEIDSAKIIFQNETNEDVKAAIITIIKENFGNEGLLEMLDAIVIDTKQINHSNGYTETIRLLQSKQKYSFLQNSKGKLNQPYAWIEMTCPSTGSVYLIDTCPTFTNALECAKWHRPNEIPLELEYLWLSAN